MVTYTISLFFLLMVVLRFSTSVQRYEVRFFQKFPLGIWALPLCVAGVVCAVALSRGTLDGMLSCSCILYAAAPTWLIQRTRQKDSAHARVWKELFAILLLWLPVEYATGAGILRPYFGHLTHIVAFGTAVSLALVLFLGFRDMNGIKYTLPHTLVDLKIFCLGFGISALALIPLALTAQFMKPFHVPENLTARWVLERYTATFAGVALPEELLFRGLMQNWLMQRFGYSRRILYIAACIFGLSHINNAAFPNWRYVCIASVAGYIYGWVFWKSSSLCTSAALHTTVNMVRHTFFR